MKKDIYIIKNKINNKVYIGQSINAAERWMKHLSDARRRSTQVIHKAMNKYGYENFWYEILESQIENYNEREIYWIKYYNSLVPNGYNVSEGGSNPSDMLKLFTEEQVQGIRNDIKNTNITFTKLAEKWGCCEEVIGVINTGKRYYDEKISYPLRETRYSKEKIKQIVYSLKYEKEKTLAQIAKEYEMDFSQLNEINQGRIHKIESEIYPLRQGKVSSVKGYVPEIIELLKNSSMNQAEIARKFNVSANCISAINKGRSFRQENEVYPIRQNGQRGVERKCFSPDEVRLIEDMLMNSSKSMRDIAQEFECGLTTILNINNGSTIKYKNNKIIYPIRKHK